MGMYYLGAIIACVFNYAPRGWFPCDGRALSINDYQALFALIGTRYGGDGTTVFNLPNLSSRVPIGVGQGPGLTKNYILAQTGGAEEVGLTEAQMPAHTHTFNVNGNNSAAKTFTPNNNSMIGIAQTEEATPGTVAIYDKVTNGQVEKLVALHPDSISDSSGGQNHENRQPFMALNYIICVEGLYPVPS